MNWLIHLYPQAWRARYEDEFLAVLEQRRFSIGDIIDVMRGALDAHLHLEAVLGRIPGMRNRQLILTIFCAYIAFVVAGLGLYGTVDDSPFVGAMHQHSALAAAWDVLAITSGAALLSVVIGGFPVARAVLRDSTKPLAAARPRGVVRRAHRVRRGSTRRLSWHALTLDAKGDHRRWGNPLSGRSHRQYRRRLSRCLTHHDRRTGGPLRDAPRCHHIRRDDHHADRRSRLGDPRPARCAGRVQRALGLF